LLWCYAAEWPLFHKSNGRSCYTSDSPSKANEDTHTCFHHITLQVRAVFAR
ncbi:hypothetical protein P692DRAFT_20743230, partial [Suillus brevipes Sb2]